jgi:hypothetical protein
MYISTKNCNKQRNQIIKKRKSKKKMEGRRRK